MSKIISSVRVETVGGHDVVTVWNRGGQAGTLTVTQGDGPRIAAHLLECVEPCEHPGVVFGVCPACNEDVGRIF